MINNKIRYGIPDYYSYYLENNDFVDRKKFNKIMCEFNKILIENILDNNLEYVAPKLDMTLCVRKMGKEIRIEDNKVVNTAPIDWKSTKELWEINPSAKAEKKLLRFLNTHTSKYVFRIKFLKNGNNFRQRNQFRFKAVRSFSRKLALRIFDKSKSKFDTYKLY